jgi:hypothetical protein
LHIAIQRFCFLKFTKPDDEHNLQAILTTSQACFFILIPGLNMSQLTSNTDNKVQKLVTVFAFCLMHLDNILLVINAPRPQSPLRCDIGAPPASAFY